MPITFDCEGCGKFYTVPDEVAGRTAKCKQCGTTNVIPAPKAKAKPAAEQPQSVSRATDKTKPMPRPRIPPVPPKKKEEVEEIVGAEVVDDDAPAPPPPKPRQAPPPRKPAEEDAEEIVGAEVIDDDEAAPPPKKRPAPPPATTPADANPFAFDTDEPPKKKRPASQAEAKAAPPAREQSARADKSRRKPADDDAAAEEDADEAEEERPRKRRKKATKQAVNPALLWGLVGGGVVLLALIAVGVLFALGVFSGEQSSAVRSGPAPKSTGDGKTVAPTDFYTAASLVSAYQRDPAAADREYKGREITVQGIATRIDKDFVELAGVPDPKTKAAASVRCYFADAKVIKTVRPNALAIVLGTCKGKMADGPDVILENCKPGQ